VSLAGWGDLFNETDGQYSGAAKVMVEGGSWLVPDNNGIPRLVKPPLTYWILASSMFAFGINEFAARVPGALAVAVLLASVALIGRETRDWKVAAFAVAVMGTSLGAFTLARIIMPEPLFSAAIAMALYCLIRAGRSPRSGSWTLGFWLFGALAAFSKGPHGLLYPLVIGAIALLLNQFLAGKPAVSWRAFLSLPGIAVAILILVPWHLYVERLYPGFLSNLFFSEHLGHISGGDDPATNYTNVPRLAFLLLHLAWFLPWSIIALFSLPRLLSPHVRTPRQWTFPEYILVAWIGVVVVSVLLAGQRQDYYALSSWAGVAILASVAIAQQSFRWPSLVLAITLLVGLLACVVVPQFLGSDTTAPVADRSTALLTVAGFGSDIWATLQGIAVATLLPGALLALLTLKKPNWGLPLWTITGAILGVGAVAGTATVAPTFSLAGASETLQKRGNSRVIFDGDIDTASSLLFYSTPPVHLVSGEKSFITKTFGIGNELYLNPSAVAERWRTAEPLILIVDQANLDKWQERLSNRGTTLARPGTFVILTNSGEQAALERQTPHDLE